MHTTVPVKQGIKASKKTTEGGVRIILRTQEVVQTLNLY